METVNAFLAAATPLILGIFSFISVRKERRDKRDKKLRDELEAIKAAQQEKEQKEKELELQKMSKQLNFLSQNLADLKDSCDGTANKVADLTKLTRYNLEYTNEINNVLICLSEGVINDNPNRDELRKQMQQHRERTSELTKVLYQITY